MEHQQAFNAEQWRAAFCKLQLTVLDAVPQGLNAYFTHYGLPYPTAYRAGFWTCGRERLLTQIFHPKNPQGTVFLWHGYFDHAGIFARLIEALLQNNWVVALYDNVGHGLSSGQRASIHCFSEYQATLSAWVNHFQPQLPTPHHFMGHSLGAGLLLEAILKKTANFNDSHVILLAPLVRPRAWPMVRFVNPMLHRIRPSLRRNFRPNSRDVSFLEFISQHDPLQAKHLPLVWVKALKAWALSLEKLPESSKKVHIIQGDEDSTVNWQDALRLLTKKLPFDIQLIPGAHHHLTNEIVPVRSVVFAHIRYLLSKAV